MPPQDRPLIRVGNRWVPGPPVVQNPNLRSLLTPEAELIVGPETSQVNVSSLQPPAPETPTPTIVDLVSKLFSDAKDWVAEQGVSGIARTVARAVPAAVEYELGRRDRMVDAAGRGARAVGRGARAVGQFAGDVVDELGEMSVPRAVNALEAFNSGIAESFGQTAPQRIFPGESNSALGKLAGGIGFGVGMVADPSPAGEARLAKKAGVKAVDTAMDVARGVKLTPIETLQQLRQRVGEERVDQLLFDWDGAFVDQDGLLRKTLSDRFGTSGREATPRVAPKHFLEWLQSPAADEMATTIVPAERADYLARVADARQALSRDIPTAGRVAEVPITKPVAVTDLPRVSEEAAAITFEQFQNAAAQGAVRSATGKFNAAEKAYEKAVGPDGTALGHGLLAGYSLPDIAAFYVQRRGGGDIGQQLGYNHFLRDAATESARNITKPVRGAEAAAAANAKLALTGKQTTSPLSHLERAPIEMDDQGRMFVSTRVPTSVKGQVKADAPLNTGLDEVLQDPELVRTFAAQIRGYNLLTDAQKKGSDEQVVRAFIDTGAENLRYMIDQMQKGGWAKFSREWYDGANNVTGRMARTYQVDPNASTGVVAVLSPQKDWHQNAEMAKRVIQNNHEFARSNPRFDRDVFNRYRQTYTSALMASLKTQVKNGQLTPVEAEWALKSNAYLMDQFKKSIVGVSWQDLSRSDRAIFLRAYDELHNGQRYPVLNPDGSVAHDFAITKSGEEAKMAWQSYGAIEKALSILDDPSIENISRMLGDEHKVRAFFDNMSRPEWGRLSGQRGPSTIDTHQVAASHLMPYGAASPVVKYTMGGASNNTLGLSGMNPLYQEMLTEAVRGNPNDYLPRAGQSVSWDGIKALFSPEQKRDKQFVAKIDALWREYQQGRMSLRGVQDAIINEAGGIKSPEWAKRK